MCLHKLHIVSHPDSQKYHWGRRRGWFRHDAQEGSRSGWFLHDSQDSRGFILCMLVAQSEHHRQDTALVSIEKERATDWAVFAPQLQCHISTDIVCIIITEPNVQGRRKNIHTKSISVLMHMMNQRSHSPSCLVHTLPSLVNARSSSYNYSLRRIYPGSHGCTLSQDCVGHVLFML